jgi:hypothetical protein
MNFDPEQAAQSPKSSSLLAFIFLADVTGSADVRP